MTFYMNPTLETSTNYATTGRSYQTCLPKETVIVVHTQRSRLQIEPLDGWHGDMWYGSGTWEKSQYGHLPLFYCLNFGFGAVWWRFFRLRKYLGLYF
jgi:hypothetical protein